MNATTNSENNNKWYAAYTKPRAEKQTYERLLENSIEAYLPLKKTLRQWSDRKKLIEVPLLPSYIFVKTSPKFFPLVYSTYGIVRFISFEGQPVSIPERQINILRLLIDSDTEVEVTTENFAKGDNVKVISGALAGITGELIQTGSNSRFIIRIDKLDQNLILKIPKAFLKKI